MKIKLNDIELQLAAGQTKLLADLMKANGLYQERGIAVAINSEIFPKSEWNHYQVKDQDNILIITATQGG